MATNYKNTVYDYFSNEENTFPRSVAKTGTISITAGDKTVIGVGTLALTEFNIGDYVYILADSEIRKITSISSNTVFYIDRPFTNAVAAANLVVTPQSEYCEIAVCIPSASAAGVLDGNVLPPGIGITWGKTGRTTSGQRDLIDPIIIDATGTVACVEGLR